MSFFPPDTEPTTKRKRLENDPITNYPYSPRDPTLRMVRQNMCSDFEGRQSAAAEMKEAQDEARRAFCKSAVDFIMLYKQIGSEPEANLTMWCGLINDMANIYFEHEMQPLSVARQTLRAEALDDLNAIKLRCAMPSPLSVHRILGGNVLNNFHEFIKMAKEAQVIRLPYLNQRGLRIEPHMFKEMASVYASLSRHI